MAQFELPLQARIAGVLQRVLVIDNKVARAQFMADLLRNFKCAVRKAPTVTNGMSLAAAWVPEVIFLSHEEGGLDGVAFTRALRHSSLTCRRAPVILQLTQPTSAVILAGRNAGAHEFLMHPVSLGDLTRRLETVLMRSREWVEAPTYIGPDRRRVQSADYRGPERRFVRYHMIDDSPAARAPQL